MEHHDGFYGFPPLFIRNPDYRDISDGRVRTDNVLHLRRVYILPSGDDHIGLSIHQRIKPVRIPYSHIAGCGPLAAKGISGFIRLIKIRLKHHRRAIKNFSHLTVLNFFPFIIKNPDPIRTEDLPADTAQFFKLIFGPQQGDQSAFSGPVSFPQFGVIKIFHDGKL